MQSKYSKGTILSFLKDVIHGTIAVNTDQLTIAPSVNADEHQIVGTIDNPVARRCLVLGWEIDQEARRLAHEHQLTHEHGHVHDPAECAKVRDLVVILSRRINAVRKLFWQYVYAQFPTLRGINANIGSNWEVYIESEENIPPKAPFDNNHPAVTFVNDLERILSGENIELDVSNVVLGKVTEGEAVIGSIDDLTLRTIWALSKRVVADMPNSEEEFEQMIHGSSLDFATNVEIRFATQKTQKGLAQEIFWAAVRETIPVANEPDTIGVRQLGHL